MKSPLFLILVIALIAIATQARLHNWSESNLRHTIPRDAHHIDLHSSSNKATTYLLAMNRRSPGKINTLHGLWISSAQDCASQKPAFDIKILDPIRDEMNTYWESWNTDNPTFWKHEFDKHLSCMRNYTQIQSFTKSLDLLHQYSHLCAANTVDCRCTLDENFQLVGSCRQK
jgi:hypothetical protein